MDHIAIMKKSWKLTDKILTGEKTIESRWYKTRRAPWNLIKTGDRIYFKDSGEPVKIQAEVEKVIQFTDLTPSKVRQIINEYGKEDGIEDKGFFFNRFKDKKYCMLIFLENPKKIMPFDINKKGYGMMCAWISLGNINKIKLS